MSSREPLVSSHAAADHETEADEEASASVTGESSSADAGEHADLPSVEELLEAAVSELGGQARVGQLQMARLVGESLPNDFGAVLVQAGTGTGKSLAYLVPAARTAVARDEPVVIATATLALQRQLVDKDLPVVVRALADKLGRPPTFAVLKGRSNYICLDRLNRGSPDPEEAALFEAPTTWLGRQAARLSAWAQQTETGDRDDLPDPVDGRVWAGLSVSGRECPGASSCAFGPDCFAEKARERAQAADLVITNHAMLAIHVEGDIPVLPDHGPVVVDEAHELVDRMTTALTRELSAAVVTRAVSRARRLVEPAALEPLEDAGDYLGEVLADLPEGRLRSLPEELVVVLTALRDACTGAAVGLKSQASSPESVAAVSAARAALEYVQGVAALALTLDERSVAWTSSRGQGGSSLHLAPISVSGLLANNLFAGHSVALTSATLSVAGGFESTAASLGCGDGWQALDVGSPFDYARQGILYCAARLPRPGRDGVSEAAIEELAELVDAAGGRTLALFSSWRSVERAEEVLERRLRGRDDRPLIVARRGDAVAGLVRRFADEPRSSLLGTMSLWQGVDVPGPACTLVVIDRIPFPRPDDPVVSARQELVDAGGGSGFAAVSVPRAALLLAQGAGRLIRSPKDRGVVAILDSRLATTGYGQALRRSLPPLWWTTDLETVTGALRRLDNDLTLAEDA